MFNVLMHKEIKNVASLKIVLFYFLRKYNISCSSCSPHVCLDCPCRPAWLRLARTQLAVWVPRRARSTSKYKRDLPSATKSCSVQLPVDVWGIILGDDKLSKAPYRLHCCANSVRPTGPDPKAPEAVPLEDSPRWRETAREGAG